MIDMKYDLANGIIRVYHKGEFMFEIDEMKDGSFTLYRKAVYTRERTKTLQEMMVIVQERIRTGDY